MGFQALSPLNAVSIPSETWGIFLLFYVWEIEASVMVTKQTSSRH